MDDLISRQAAIDALMERFKRVPTTAIIAKDTIENLPSAQPKKKTGSWEINEHTYACNNRRNWKCTNCCTEKYDFIFTSVCKPEWSYCPNCGADMRGEQNE